VGAKIVNSSFILMWCILHTYPQRKVIAFCHVQIFHDKAHDREIQGLEVRCRHNGCPWTGALSNEQHHYIFCDKKFSHYGNYMAKQESPVMLMNGKYDIYPFQSEVGFVPPAQNHDQVTE